MVAHCFHTCVQVLPTSTQLNNLEDIAYKKIKEINVISLLQMGKLRQGNAVKLPRVLEEIRT